MKSEKLILSIETAVRGGSISILKNGAEIDFWIGEQEVSKSEDVLQQIAVLFEKNEIKRSEIDSIIVSNGPGSFTGLRIGFATALGLKKSFGCSLSGVSLLEALNLPFSQIDQKTSSVTAHITAIPFGKNMVGWQEFGIKNRSLLSRCKINLSGEKSFLDVLKTKDNVTLTLHRYLFDKFEEILKTEEMRSRLKIRSEINLARQIGIYGETTNVASDNEYETNLNFQPIYL